MGGGGKFAPPAENRPFSLEKMKIFKNGWTEKLDLRNSLVEKEIS